MIDKVVVIAISNSPKRKFLIL